MAKNIKKKFKPKEEKDIAKEELKSLENLPLVGGLFKGLGKFVELVERVEEAGGEIKRRGEIKGLGGKTKGIYGFSIRTGIGEMPKIQTFGNIKTVKEKEKPKIKITEEREPIIDVFDEKDEILIVAELPGVSKESIKIDIKGDILILEASDSKKKFAKEILLSSPVDIKSKKLSYKNGILKVKLKKRKT